MRNLFVDTGAWIALLRRDDARHAEANAFYKAAARDAKLITTNYVVDETVTRLRYDAGLRSALDFKKALDHMIETDRVRLVWIDHRLEKEGLELLQRYADVTLSLTDATSAAVARRRKIGTIFGFDSDFRALGFDVAPAAR